MAALDPGTGFFIMQDFEHLKCNQKYLINRAGQVFSLRRNIYLKPQKHSSGYPMVCISGKNILLHRLIAIQFIANPENKPQVNHIDSDRNNYYVENLEWCTHSENMKHAIRCGRKNKKWQSKKPIKTRDMNLFHAQTIRILYSRDYTYNDINKIFPMSSASFYRIINNESWVTT